MSTKEFDNSIHKAIPLSNKEQRELREAVEKLENELPEKLNRFSGITSLIVSQNLFDELRSTDRISRSDNWYMLEIPIHGAVASTKKVFVLKDLDLARISYYYSPYSPQEIVILVKSLHRDEVKTIPVGPLVGVLFVSDRIKGVIIVNDTVHVLFERAELVATLLEASLKEFLTTSSVPSELAEEKNSNEVRVAEPELTIESIFLQKLAEVRKNRQ